MKPQHVFTPVLLDLETPIVFPETLSLLPATLAARQPAPDILNGPWYQYADRLLSRFHAEGVTENFASFLARALGEAHEMGQHGLQPAKPGTPRGGHTTKAQITEAAVRERKRLDKLAGAALPVADPAPVKTATRITRGVTAPAAGPVRRITRAVR